MNSFSRSLDAWVSPSHNFVNATFSAVRLRKSVPAPRRLQQWKQCPFKVRRSRGEGVITSVSKSCHAWPEYYLLICIRIVLIGYILLSQWHGDATTPASQPWTKYYQFLSLEFLQLNCWDLGQCFPYVDYCSLMTGNSPRIEALPGDFPRSLHTQHVQCQLWLMCQPFRPSLDSQHSRLRTETAEFHHKLKLATGEMMNVPVSYLYRRKNLP
ncbi:uncharacterized protein LOC107399584 [Peromyscus maniculatus bairdii]|uniref:uncharacterized protein LOC107399584 n=1 Tax=Peromyscus maniculatus bairdii TaxID=230844 RepID=UPI003FD0E6FE